MSLGRLLDWLVNFCAQASTFAPAKTSRLLGCPAGGAGYMHLRNRPHNLTYALRARSGLCYRAATFRALPLCCIGCSLAGCNASRTLLGVLDEQGSSHH